VSALLLVAHGSSYPRAAATTRALGRAVAAVRPGSVVTTAYLDHAGPRPDEALARLQAAGQEAVTVVPLLLTAAYHGRIDLPAVVAKARAAGVHVPVAISDVLGPTAAGVPDLLLAGLCRRLAQARAEYDAVVLAAAGTRDVAARATVELAARALGHRLGLPCLPAYASAAAPTAGEAVSALRHGGARQVAMASYFLAPGKLYDVAVESAHAAGAVTAAAPLGAATELAHLVLARADAVRPVVSTR
jgi:sirohydrochlorin ferrochelatase